MRYDHFRISNDNNIKENILEVMRNVFYLSFGQCNSIDKIAKILGFTKYRVRRILHQLTYNQTTLNLLIRKQPIRAIDVLINNMNQFKYLYDKSITPLPLKEQLQSLEDLNLDFKCVNLKTYSTFFKA